MPRIHQSSMKEVCQHEKRNGFNFLKTATLLKKGPPLQKGTLFSFLCQEPSYLWMDAGEGSLVAAGEMRNRAEVCTLGWSGMEEFSSRCAWRRMGLSAG